MENNKPPAEPSPRVERQTQKLFDDIRNYVQIQKADEPKLLEILAAHNSVSVSRFYKPIEIGEDGEPRYVTKPVSAEAKPPQCPKCGSGNIGILESHQEGCVNVIKCPDCGEQWECSGLLELAAFFPPERGEELHTAEELARKVFEQRSGGIGSSWGGLRDEQRDYWLEIAKSHLAALACVQEGRR